MSPSALSHGCQHDASDQSCHTTTLLVILVGDGLQDVTVVLQLLQVVCLLGRLLGNLVSSEHVQPAYEVHVCKLPSLGDTAVTTHTHTYV